MTFRKFWQIFGIIIACLKIGVLCESYAECADPGKNSTFVASRTDCSKYIFCNGDKSFQGQCLDDNLFNEVAGNCDDPDTVECKLGFDMEATSSIPTSSPSESYDDNSNEVVNNTDDGYWSPNPPIGASPQCPPANGGSNMVYLPNPEMCAAYFFCYHGAAIPLMCPSNMHFNSVTSRCERKEQVHCASQRPIRFQCRKGVYDFIPHPRNCEYYYYCASGFLMIYQCPYNFMWHYERRACVHRSQAKCYSRSIIQHTVETQLF